jgi:hypothetical protein
VEKPVFVGWAVVVPRRFSLVHLILVTFAKNAENHDLVTKFDQYCGYLLPEISWYFQLRNFKHDFYAKVVTDIFRWNDDYWWQRKTGLHAAILSGEDVSPDKARLENQR